MQSSLAEDMHGCPCCKCLTSPKRGQFTICPVCYWEDDGCDDSDDRLSACGPNRMTLREGRDNYARVGACDPAMLPRVRPPRRNELAQSEA